MSISGQALITFFLCKNEGLELLCPCLALFCEGYQYACGLYGEGPCDGEMFRMVWGELGKHLGGVGGVWGGTISLHGTTLSQPHVCTLALALCMLVLGQSQQR